MKKLLGLILTSFIFINSIFAFNFFTDRFFEVRVDVPFGMSNNVFALGDYMKKDLEIDLPAIADSIPETGWSTIIRTNPEVAIKLNIAAFSLGVNVGADIYTKLNVDKGLFDFLFKGYHSGETLKVGLPNPVLDTFVYAEVPIGLKLKRFTLNVTPGVFYPVAILDDSDIYATAINDEKGNVGIDVNVNANLYTTSMAGPMLDTNYNGPAADINTIVSNLGFDLGAYFKMPLTKRLALSIDARIPIVPAKLDAKMNVNAKFHMDGNIMDTALDGKQFNQTPFDYTMTTTPLAEPYKVSRPLKLNGYVDYKLFGFLQFKGGGGFAVRRPGSSNPIAYPEYYLSAGLSLFEMLKATFSTEYTDLLFKHQLELVVNLRFVEVDAGISFEASNFLRSFDVGGFGAHVGVVVGL